MLIQMKGLGWKQIETSLVWLDKFKFGEIIANFTIKSEGLSFLYFPWPTAGLWSSFKLAVNQQTG